MKKILFKRKRINLAAKDILFAATLLLLLSCEDFVKVDPPTTEIVGATVYTDDASATAALVGIYADLLNVQFGIGNGGPTIYGGLSSDEFDNFSISYVPFVDNSLTSTNAQVGNLWAEAYSRIFAANSVIEGLKKSVHVSPNLNDQLTGEALFIRAFIHFYLVNFFGDIPYITSTDYRINTKANRIPIAQVYEYIISDLKQAQSLLVDDYSFSKGERVRPNKAVTMAMLSRVYLYTKDWANAESSSTDILNNINVYSLENDLNKVFLPKSVEAILQLAPTTARNTAEGLNFVLTSTPRLIAISPALVDSFEPNDLRLDKWVGRITVGAITYSYPFKYKVITSTVTLEYYMVFRLAEQYLIRAEARAQQGNITGSQTDLNRIRNRAGLSNTSAADQSSLLLAIENERRRELFAEWGHRWLDLKRTNRANTILKPLKLDWQPTDELYPIPKIQIDNNLKFPQNPGYL